ncbi:MAG TPA: hypothetical protein VFG04_03860 [Planctomycetaceae bacterium]|jgi:hypothetical protein|nr:hypothetical protein [Planctomycetaceae bacterium]
MKVTKWKLALMFLASTGVFAVGIVGLVMNPDRDPELAAALAGLGFVLIFICCRTYNRRV